MSIQFINSEAMCRSLKDEINKQMISAAEPVIQQAIKDVEAKMRLSMATMFIALIDNSFSMERDMTDIRISVHQPKS